MNENNDKLYSEQKINDTTSSAKILPWMGTDSNGSKDVQRITGINRETFRRYRKNMELSDSTTR